MREYKSLLDQSDIDAMLAMDKFVPDCRTCRHIFAGGTCLFGYVNCINGAAYVPSPPLHIWEQKP